MDAAYTTLPFPFAEIKFPQMVTGFCWTLDYMLGYLSTWSALQHFIRQNGRSPLDADVVAALRRVWPEGQYKIAAFWMFGRVAKMPG